MDTSGHFWARRVTFGHSHVTFGHEINFGHLCSITFGNIKVTFGHEVTLRHFFSEKVTFGHSGHFFLSLLGYLHVTLVTFGNFLFGILFDDFWTLPSQPHTANKYRKAPKVITFKYQFSSLEKCSI